MTGIIIILYNNPAFLLHQHAHLKAYCTDEYRLLVVDNSTDKEAIEAIKYHCERLELSYIKTNAASLGGSDSHAFAAGIAYNKFRFDYDILFYLDHDCFPIKPFSPAEILGITVSVETKCGPLTVIKGKVMAGLGQQRKGLKYFWPGCFMFRTSVGIDFSMTPGFDTGGNTHKAIIEHGEDQCIFFDEAYCQNPFFNKSQYNSYALINNGMFLHFINGSNWANSSDNDERLNSLFNVLDQYKTDEIL